MGGVTNKRLEFFDIEQPVPQGEKAAQLSDLAFGAPVKLVVSAQYEVVVPAFVAYQLIEKTIDREYEELQKFCLSFVMPEVFINRYAKLPKVFRARGASSNVLPKVPTSLLDKLTLQGALKLEQWLSTRTLNYKALKGVEAEAEVFKDLEGALSNKNVLEVIEDGQGRLSVVLERPGQTNQVVTVHPTSTGEAQITTFDPAYNPNLNPNITAPLSKNKLVPDYANTAYLHPATKNKVIKIEMKGNRNADFKAANEAAGFGSTYNVPTYTKPDGTIVQYTWHHLDDFEIINGKAFCTMQLVEKAVHGGSGVTGMAHTGAVAQWKAYYGSGY